MSDDSKPFAFSQFVPGFDFLRNLAGGSAASAGAVPGMPSLSSWVAPTLSVEEVDKRIQELKTVQYWLEQNGHALKATIQALEVQKMTLSTLRGMNVRMEDLANSFTRQAVAAMPTAAAAPEPDPRPDPFGAPAPAAEPEPEAESESEAEPPASARKAGAAEGAGVVDPLQWWGALTQQFQQIAASALQDAAHLRMPAMPTGGAAPARSATRSAAKSSAKPAVKAAAKKAPAKKKGSKTAARKGAASAAPAAPAAPAPRRGR